MDEARLQEIEARANAATPGPWTYEVNDRASTGSAHFAVKTAYAHPRHPHSARYITFMCGGLGESRYLRHPKPDDYREDPETEADTDFVAHARTDVPDLVAEVRRLTAALATVTAERDAACIALMTARGEVSDARAEVVTARREGAEEVLAMSDPWPLHDVLAKLAEASRALLNRYNYDGHGWELILAACDSADAIVARIHARALPLDGDGGAR